MFEGKQPRSTSAKVAEHVGLPGRAQLRHLPLQRWWRRQRQARRPVIGPADPSRDLDVHMSADGLNFACTACHVTKDHVWAGSRYNLIAKDQEGQG